MSNVSVILPFKNAEGTLLLAIKSVLDQTFDDFELVLIDDNSQDGSLAIATSISDERIRIFSNPSMGIASALNFGIKLASGEYIARMDADDKSEANRLQEQLNYANEHPQIDVVSCLVEHRSIDSSKPDTRGYSYYVNWLNVLVTPEDHYMNRFVDATIAHPTLFCRKDLFDKYGYYNSSELPEDFELWLRWMEQGATFAKVEKVLYQWFDYSNRLSRTHGNYSSDKFFSIKAEFFAKWWQKQRRGNLWIWGYGKDVFRRSAHLEDFGIHINGFIDIKERPSASRSVLTIDKVKKSDDDFYLIYISDRKGKALIRSYLNNEGMKPNEDYLFMA